MGVRVTKEPLPGRHLLVASTGGHLAQLNIWAERIGSAPDSIWVTFDSPQSRSTLEERRALYVPYINPRDKGAACRAFARIMREIDWRREDFTAAVSTGSAVGVAGLAAARLHKVPSFFFESVSRVFGPSMSGKLVGLDPWIQKSCQYEHWAGGKWKYRGSLLDSFETIPKVAVERPRIFVTLGTIRPYRFDSLVDAVLATGMADDRTVWQLGTTTRTDLPGQSFEQVSSDDFDRYAKSADVVITHAGVGTLLHLFEMGIYPVAVPRRLSRDEMVDDHQIQIAQLLEGRGITAVREVGDLDAQTIISSSANAIRISPQRAREPASR